MRISGETRSRLRRSIFKRTTHPFDPELVYFDPFLAFREDRSKIDIYEICYVCRHQQDHPCHDGIETEEVSWRQRTSFR